jgi:hypothetical protein
MEEELIIPTFSEPIEPIVENLLVASLDASPSIIVELPIEPIIEPVIELPIEPIIEPVVETVTEPVIEQNEVPYPLEELPPKVPVIGAYGLIGNFLIKY